MKITFEVDDEAIKNAAKKMDKPIEEVKEDIKDWYKSYETAPYIFESELVNTICNY